MKHMQRTFLVTIALVALSIFGATLVRALWYAPELEVAVPATSAVVRSVPPEEQPARLSIPSLDIDADIQYVGVNAKGNMGVPSNFKDVAWYKYGTVPGQLGSAVIAGHVDNGLGLAGVFKHLGDIKVGDDVYIETKNGSTLHFKVVEKASYQYQSAPLERIFNRKDDAYLNLIACEGNWVKNEKTYDQRLVIYTKLVP